MRARTALAPQKWGSTSVVGGTAALPAQAKSSEHGAKLYITFPEAFVSGIPVLAVHVPAQLGNSEGGFTQGEVFF
jgi:hypothetical protein